VSARELVVGTRGSALALAQTEIVCGSLRRLDSSVDIRVERITTTGDERADIPLSQLGRGIFVTEIEAALREGRIDFAVHSAKDLPSTLADDLVLGAILPRADARDVLVSRYGTLRKLPIGARVGTGSPRRACQLLALRPDLEPCDVRGNVDTRLRKLAAGEYDALVLAGAGLIRLGRQREIAEWLDPIRIIPSVGQGALAVEVRADDGLTLNLVQLLDHRETRAAVTAERAFLAELGAGCGAAAGAHARVEGRRLHIIALIGSVDGRSVRSMRSGDVTRPAELGASLARELLRDGGAAFLAHEASALRGKTIAITRPAEEAGGGGGGALIELLRAHGAEPVCCPTIAIERVSDFSSLDTALRELVATRWVVFTSANAVHTVADRLSTLGLHVPGTTLLAAVGGATADAVERRIRRANFVPSASNGETLANELPGVDGYAVLFPRGDLASDVIPSRLRARGARVRDVVVYRTVAGPGVVELAARVRQGTLAAIAFTSPSSVRFAADIFATHSESNGRPAIVSIGPTTARAARELGLDPDAEARTQSVGGIVEALERCLAARERAATPSPSI
jgi:hydroxymethylbilane synthase